jgi:deoxyribodipyrimidine photo-lyase
MIQPERLFAINSRGPRSGRYVLYWMQASQRSRCNHALEHAIDMANALKLPLLACFGLTGDYPEANLRHYTFMLQGLAETSGALARRGIQLVVRTGSPPQVAGELAAEAAAVVADRGYLRHQVRWRASLARSVKCPAFMVESDVVVPVQTASDKREYAARTIRPRLHSQWQRFLLPLRQRRLRRDSLGMKLAGLDLSDIAGVLAGLGVDGSLGASRHFVGGAATARKLLARFIAGPLGQYGDNRGDPSLDIQSHMSPYLHFGQISPLEIALAVQAAPADQRAKDVYLEELLVRRELCINFVAYCSRYDSYDSLPGWARASLRKHSADRRPQVYTPAEMENSATADPYFNAAMTEMRITGKMHNYMRMYWGKKIIEWSPTPRRAWRTMLALNNRHFIDGRDPLSYANVGWCFGLHDRPWKERPIFGTIRYMNAQGLERKFDIGEYVRMADRLSGEERFNAEIAEDAEEK